MTKQITIDSKVYQQSNIDVTEEDAVYYTKCLLSILDNVAKDKPVTSYPIRIQASAETETETVVVEWGDCTRHPSKWHCHGGYSNDKEVDKWLASQQPQWGWLAVGAKYTVSDDGEEVEKSVFYLNGVAEKWIIRSGNLSSSGESYNVKKLYDSYRPIKTEKQND